MQVPRMSQDPAPRLKPLPEIVWGIVLTVGLITMGLILL